MSVFNCKNMRKIIFAFLFSNKIRKEFLCRFLLIMILL